MFIVFGRHFERSTALPCHILAPSPASSSVHGGLCPPMSYYIWAFLHCCVVAAQPQLRLIRTCTVSFLRQAQLRLIRTCCLVSSYTAYSIATAAHPHLLSRLLLRSIASAAHPHLCVLSHLRHNRIFAYYRTCGTSASLRILSQLRHIRTPATHRTCGSFAIRISLRALYRAVAFAACPHVLYKALDQV